MSQHKLFFSFIVLLGLCRAVLAQQPERSDSGANGYVGNEVCARCHAPINDSYSRTNMAHASGPAAENFIPADFTDQKSRVHYRIYKEDGHIWLSFDRPDAAPGQSDSQIHGKRELLYYIGSGHRGLTYLFSVDGFVFESPINFYGKKRLWDMTPAYQEATEIPLNLPAFTSCLHCHISEMRPPIAGTEYRYSMPLLPHSGVTCERCHGPGALHATAAGGKNADGSTNLKIVNPAKLPPVRRDQICMQCHMEGKVAIERSGRHVYDYRPGDNLSDFVRYYVLEGGSALGAVSQVEAMSQSVCKKKSGDKMSCTSCHDPHNSPSAIERVSYYRRRCLACHGSAFSDKHHPEQPDCAGCHMPVAQSSDVAHTQVTDHRIPRRAQPSTALLQDLNSRPEAPRLIAFPGNEEAAGDSRDRALALQSLAEGGSEPAATEAEKLLRSALQQSPKDPALLSAMGYIEQKRGAGDRARELYKKALESDPDSVDTLNNLGVIEARAGDVRQAVKLWEDAFKRAPGTSQLGMNIATALCQAGKFDEARTFVLRVLEFNPDFGAGKKLLRNISHQPASCGS